VLKIILVVCCTQIFQPSSTQTNQISSGITPTQALVFYLWFVFACMFRRFIKNKLYEYYRKHKKDKLSKDSIYNIGNNNCIKMIDKLNKLSLFIILLLPLCKDFVIPFDLMKLLIKLLIMCIPFFITVTLLVLVWCHNYLEKSLYNTGRVIFYEPILNPIKNYIKNHSRLYLRINFGHKLLKDEKDILRLIARTLSTEYHKFRYSFLQMLPWRVMAFGLLFLFAYLFSTVVKEQKFYEPIKKSDLYNASSQIFLNDSDTIYINGTIFKKKNMTDNKINKRNEIKEINEIRLQIVFSQESKFYKVKTLDGKFYTVKTFFRVLDQLVFEISRKMLKIPQYLWDDVTDDESFFKEIKIVKFISPINYLFWLSFFLMYLFCILLFRCTWITQFFVTHRIIMRKLKKLNSDITHSTERENSINVNSGSASPNLGIGTTTKKSRNVADAREIEKELQDILNDMQQIPVIMCRPKVVIVFDELDKVEPGDTNSEKENQQTKASIFSIDATRERQTEILRILSNMKYFLSTARAKFILVAGREMFDIHLADVSERNNYIGSIFNIVISVPSFLTDHPTGKESLPQESSIASLPEEFVCRRLIPHDYQVESYDLKTYRMYLEKEIFYEDIQNEKLENCMRQEKIQKTITVLQQFIIYLAHVSKGAPKKMMQLFESFVEIHTEKDENNKNTLFVQRYRSSRHFLSFNYYKQYTLGIIAYLITPIFYRLSESNIKEHSDKLLVSTLRFVDFLFKFHKYSFSWKNLEISPEMLEVNRAPELKSVAVDLLNYLTQIHINKSNFSLYDYKFDSWIANEIFTMTKTDDVFSALFSFSLDEMLPLKKHYLDLLKKTEKEYQDGNTSNKYTDAISSLQIVLGDLHYYDDELEEAMVYYKNAVQLLHENDMSHERLYLYVRNKLKIGVIHERRKQYDFAYLTYGEVCKQIILERNITIEELGAGIVLRREYDYINDKDTYVFVKSSTTRKVNKKGKKVKVDKEDKRYYDNIEVPRISFLSNEVLVDPLEASPQPLNFKKISPNTNNMLFKKMTYEGLKMLYLPFIAKLQILEKSHIGGITRNHLEQLDKEFEFLTSIIDHEEAKLLEAEFLSRVADILYYKNSDLKCKKDRNRKDDNDEDKQSDNNDNKENPPKNYSCTACRYYHKALSILLGKTKSNKPEDKDENTVIKLLYASVDKITKDNYNMKYYTILARILSDWGNVFFSCDSRSEESECR
jgi:hypothetical protein